MFRGNFYGKGKVTKLIDKGEYYNKYIYINDNGDKFLVYINNCIELEENQKIIFNGEFEKPTKQRNKGGFDYSKYMYSQNLYGSIFVKNEKNIEKMEVEKLNLISFIQKSIYASIEKLLPKDQLGILLGMLIGDTFYISDEIEESFKLSGITHLLAVSGSNITYIIVITKFLFNKILGKSISNYITIIMIILFVLISGASPSVVRAGIMAIILILSEILARQPNTISSVAFTALLILLYNPLIIYDIGFILSFGGTIGIILLNPLVKEFLNYKLSFFSQFKLVRYIFDMLSVTVSAQIILLPVMWYFFNNISIISIITNLLVGPFVGVITILGLIIYFLSVFFNPLAKILSYSVYVLISLIIFISKVCSKIPFGNLTLPTPSILFIITYYLIISLPIIKIKKAERDYDNAINILKFVVVILIGIQIVSEFIPKKYIDINIIDIGQGDSTLIKTNNYNILIDGGGSENSDYDVGESILIPYLLDNTNGIIDLMIISHFHEDHAEGCLSVLEKLSVRKIIIGMQPKNTELYKRLLKISKEKEIPIIILTKGDVIELDNVKLEILFPKKELESEDLNNNSLVIRLDYKEISMLFTGDIEEKTENILVSESEKNNIIDVDILKVAHHGSKTSSTDNFLKMVTPQIAVISLGENNKFGHPAKEVIKRMEKLDCLIYRTDIFGEISLRVYNTGKIRVNTHMHNLPKNTQDNINN